MKKPNLFIIGAMKSGTTSLARYLELHPQIFVPRVKEPFHFSREENWSKGNTEYLDLFLDSSDEVYRVDASTDYTKRPKYENVAERIYEFNSDVKIVYLLRDPFERIVSNYKHEVKRKRVSDKLIEIIKKPNDIIFNSHYSYQLEPYIERFGKENIYVTTFEEMKNDSKMFFKDLFNWLKIDEQFIPINIEEKYNVTPKTINEIDENSTITNLMRKLKSNKIIKMFTPTTLQEWLKERILPRNTIADFNSEEFIKDIKQVGAILEPILVDWIQDLETLTGKSYSQWDSYSIKNNPINSDNHQEIWFPSNLRQSTSI